MARPVNWIEARALAACVTAVLGRVVEDADRGWGWLGMDRIVDADTAIKARAKLDCVLALGRGWDDG